MTGNISQQVLKIAVEQGQGNTLVARTLVEKFDPIERPLALMAIASLAESGVIRLVFKDQAQEDILEAQVLVVVAEAQAANTRPGREPPRDPLLEVVLTVPELLRPSLPGFKSTKEALREIILQCGEELLVLAPYMTPTFVEDLSDEFRELAAKGCRISLVTREAGRTPDSKRALLRLHEIFTASSPSGSSKLAVYQYWSPIRNRDSSQGHYVALHAKLLIQDSARAYVGSANWLEESLGRNLEIGLLTRDPSVVSSLRTVFEAVLPQASKVSVGKFYDGG
jgi:phosphatidylserine/phosphatidylglycerophosphate/cardiolipin synthase-like enzyme